MLRYLKVVARASTILVVGASAFPGARASTANSNLAVQLLVNVCAVNAATLDLR